MGCTSPLFWLACMFVCSLFPLLSEKEERPATEAKADPNCIRLLLKAGIFAFAGPMNLTSDELSQDDMKVQISPYTNS